MVPVQVVWYDGGLKPPRPVELEANRKMPADGIIALDNGMYKIWFARNYPAHSPNTVLLDNALATMGAFVAFMARCFVACPRMGSSA